MRLSILMVCGGLLSGCLINEPLYQRALSTASGGGSACLSVQESFVDLGPMAVDSDEYATLVFTASCAVTVREVVLEGELGDAFRILGSYEGYELAAEDVLPIDVNTSLFAPLGANLSKVTVQTSDGSAAGYVGLNAVAPKIKLSRGGHDFGPVDPSQSQLTNLQIFNEGLIDTDVRVTSASGVLSPWEGSYFVAAGGAATVTIEVDVTDLSPVASYVDFAIDGNSQAQFPLYANNCGNGEVNKYDLDGDGRAACAGDCGDEDSGIGPHAREIPDDVDQDCDTRVDEGTLAYDDDGDGYCEGFDYGSGSLECQGAALVGDCTDGLDASFDGDIANPNHPDDPNNGIDDDCDGTVDEGSIQGEDVDSDGFTPAGGDCLDDPTVFPGAIELADGKDNDCDNKTDEGFDGFDDDGDGVTEFQGDCDDHDDTICPACSEAARGVDDDCDGTIDEGSSVVDDDGDGDSELTGDCDDGDIEVHRGAVELANGADDDCDTFVDEGVLDGDGDGFTADDGDCDDDNFWAQPQLPVELCDGVDNDCDEAVDEGCD